MICEYAIYDKRRRKAYLYNIEQNRSGGMVGEPLGWAQAFAQRGYLLG